MSFPNNTDLMFNPSHVVIKMLSGGASVWIVRQKKEQTAQIQADSRT